MIQISDAQMKVFRKSLQKQLEEELFEHACSAYPDHLRLFGPVCVRRLVRIAIDTTTRLSLVSTAAYRLVLRVSLECGVAFDSDPLLAFLEPIVASFAPERQRIAELAAAADRYSEKTAPGLRTAAANFRTFRTDWRGCASSEEYLNGLRCGCIALFPEKAALVSEPAWLSLVQKATAAAAERGWRTVSAHGVLFALHFLGGSGLLLDPRFAFIQSLSPAEPPADPGVILHQAARKEFERWFALNS